jgi:hypothetical protein
MIHSLCGQLIRIVAFARRFMLQRVKVPGISAFVPHLTGLTMILRMRDGVSQRFRWSRIWLDSARSMVKIDWIFVV